MKQVCYKGKLIEVLDIEDLKPKEAKKKNGLEN